MEGEHEAEILALEVSRDGQKFCFHMHSLTVLAGIKAEKSKLNGRRAALKAKFGNLKVKRQASPIRVPRSAVAEVIDLTLEYVQVSLSLYSMPENFICGSTQGLASGRR